MSRWCQPPVRLASALGPQSRPVNAMVNVTVNAMVNVTVKQECAAVPGGPAGRAGLGKRCPVGQ